MDSVDAVCMKTQKVFFVANAFLPNERAHGVQIMHMCQGFSENEKKTVLLVPKKPGVVPEDIKIFYGFGASTFTIVQLPILNLPRVFGKCVFLMRWVSFTVSAWWYLFRHAEQRDIVYVRGEMVLPLALMAQRFRLCFETHIKPGNMRLYLTAMKRCHALITVTHLYADELVEAYGVSREKIIVEPDAVALDKFVPIDRVAARQTLGLPLDKTLIVYTGSDRPWKGLSVFKEAALHLPDTFRAVFVGAIDMVYQDDSRFIYAGFQKHETMRLWMSAADYLLVTGSHTAPESQRYTSPLKLFEYMAAQRPIIASDIPSFREVLHEDMAIFVSASDARAVASRITEIVPADAMRCAERAFLHVQQYTWKLRVKRILAHSESVPLTV